ncbi:glycosyltransferase [Candidatus Kaiserbacteria bacterium]|nr:glycosyltransferase [Candidatus Kaiserbacteria bacterium]
MRFCYFGIYDPEFSRNRIYMRALRDAGHEIIECRDNSRGLLKYIRLVQRLRALKGSYDVILVGYPGHIVVPLARLFGAAPVVSDLLGSLSDAAEHTYDAGFFVRTWYSWVDRLAVAFSDAILVDSELQKEYMQRRYGSGKKYRVVYTGADEEVFGPRGERGVTRTEPFVVLFRGRLIPQAGIMHILDAAEGLQNDKRFAFRIIGYGPLLEAVRERAGGLSNVELIAEHISFDEMRRLMLDADVSLGQFGDNERSDRNIPHKAYESISMGIPYLTARVPGISELLEDEVSCLMVPLENSEAIKAALERLRDDRPLGKQLAEMARAVYEAHASARVIASAITAVSVSCVEAKKKLAKRSLEWIGKREMVVVLVLLAAFVAIRLPGLSLPYHQDEAKIGEIVRSHMVGALSGHPPLTELLYLSAGDIVGSDHLRLIPLIFGVLSAILLYAIVRRRAGLHAAYASLALYIICMYGVFASLMVDTDGAVLPTLFLAAVYAYDRFRDAASARVSYVWLSVLALALIAGFLTKLSFVLVLGALALDYLFEVRHRLTRRLLIRAVFAALVCGVAAAVALASAHFFLPSFDVSQTILHALSYVRFEGRGYLQILIQAVKAVFYLSPLLLLPLVFLTKDTFTKNRIFFVYLGLGAFFYFVLFDFSQGALDKYLMYTIVPLAAIMGTIFTDAMRGLTVRALAAGSILGAMCATLLVALNFLSPSVMPLYPKTEWLSAIAAGNWNILMPFTGGDGPIGFYVSFLVIAAGFGISAALAALALFVPKARGALLVALIVVGVAFNGIFIEEYIWGRINGSAPSALRASLAYIASSDDVKSIISHGEIGAYELRGMGKFSGRFYAVPGYEEGHKALFSKFTGAYLVVGVPRFNDASFYSKFFSTCTPIFTTSSGVINAYVYGCAGSDPYAIK